MDENDSKSSSTSSGVPPNPPGGGLADNPSSPKSPSTIPGGTSQDPPPPTPTPNIPPPPRSPVTGPSPAPMPTSNPPPGIQKPTVGPEKKEEPEPKEPGGGFLKEDKNQGDLPPVVTPPKKSSKAKIVATVIGILLLIVAIPAGIILVQQQQELREKAGSVGVMGDCSSQAECADNLTCRDGKCRWNSGIGDCCGIDAQCAGKAVGEVCNQDNQSCESGKSCGPAGGGGGVTVGWGHRCNGPSCESGFQCRNDSQGLERCLLSAGSVGTEGQCKDQTECGDNLTCRDGKCLLNSGIQGCCGLDQQCPSGQTCSISNGACESGFSCGSGGQGNPKAAWGVGCGEVLCEEGQGLSCRLSSVGVNKCLKATGSLGTLQDCKDQTECGDNLTCREINGETKCRINSGLQGCCGANSQCPNGQTCSIDNGACESNKSCDPNSGGGGTTPTPTPIAGRCPTPTIKVYKYPYGAGDVVATSANASALNNVFKKGDRVRFSISVTDNPKVNKVEFCISGFNNEDNCTTIGQRSSATITHNGEFYKDYTMLGVSSVRVKARCTY